MQDQIHHQRNNIFSARTPYIVWTLRSLFVFLFFLATTSFAQASTTIGTVSTVYKYAWGNIAGYVNFAPAHSKITVTSSVVSGYAWSANDGWINLSPAFGGVKNDGNGVLSGFAWDEVAGWVDFSGVTIDSSGVFHGKATGGVINGANYAINFDCASCGVQTDWRPASSRSTASKHSSLIPVLGGSGAPNPLPGANVPIAQSKISTSSSIQITNVKTQSPTIDKNPFKRSQSYSNQKHYKSLSESTSSNSLFPPHSSSSTVTNDQTVHSTTSVDQASQSSSSTLVYSMLIFVGVVVVALFALLFFRFFL